MKWPTLLPNCYQDAKPFELPAMWFCLELCLRAVFIPCEKRVDEPVLHFGHRTVFSEYTGRYSEPMMRRPSAMEEENDNPFFSDVDLGDFRVIVAMYVKLLVRARWKSDPQFLSAEELSRWKLHDIEQDGHSVDWLLAEAAGVLSDINTKFIRRCGSGGIKELDESTPVGRLVQQVPFLAKSEGGGPEHNGALLEAVETLEAKKTVDWCSLVDWVKLPKIRDDLDCLPEPHSNRSDEPKAEANVFRRSGGDWQIRFAGGLSTLHMNSVGLFYIHLLIQVRGRAWLPSELLAARTLYAAPSRLNNDLLAESDALAQMGHSDPASHGDELIDSKGKESLRLRLNEIEEELADCRDRDDIGRDGLLRKEKEQILNYLSKATGLGGRSIRMSPQAKKVRNSVRISIERAIAKVAKKDRALSNHLKGSLMLKHSFCYEPEQPVNWVS